MDSMTWVKLGKEWVAQGEYGKFIINKSRGLYYAKYESDVINFNFPPSKFIKKLKEMCQDNFYWEI